MKNLRKIEVSIVIVSYNTKRLLADCLRSVFRYTKGLEFEVIVVDNASNDGSPQMLRRDFPEVVLVENNQNWGFGKANNIGVKRSRGNVIIFLNSDTFLRENAFLPMVRLLNRSNDVGVVGCKLLNADGTDQPSAALFYNLWVVFLMLFGADRLLRKSYNKVREVDWVVGACMAVKRRVFEDVGGFDQNFFMYIEESELCYRIRQAGYKVIFSPNSRVYHIERGSSPSGKRFAIVNIYKGLLYLYSKHFPQRVGWLKMMLRSKAAISYLLGVILGNKYLKETYEQAYNLV